MDMTKAEKHTDLGEQLRGAFAKSGLTRNALARQSGVSYAVVHRFIGGERDVTLATASRLCKVLGLVLRPAAPRPRGFKKGR